VIYNSAYAARPFTPVTRLYLSDRLRDLSASSADLPYGLGDLAYAAGPDLGDWLGDLPACTPAYLAHRL
jgi:hypothetical protein